MELGNRRGIKSLGFHRSTQNLWIHWKAVQQLLQDTFSHISNSQGQTFNSLRTWNLFFCVHSLFTARQIIRFANYE